MRFNFVIVALVVGTACNPVHDFQCAQDTNCDLASGGTCLAAPATGNHWCAYPNSTCPSGYSYSKGDVGDGVSGSCVIPADAGVIADAGITEDTGTAACKFRIAFVDSDGPGFQILATVTREVWVSNLDGSGLLNLSKNETADDTDPSWSPDGLKIAFASNRTGKYDIYSVSSTGGSLTNLTSTLDLSPPFGAELPVWSPDNARIAFGHGYDIWAMRSDGTGAFQIPSQRDFGGSVLAWSPNGKQLVFDSNTDGAPALYVVNVDDGSPAFKLNSGGAGEGPASWAPRPRITFDSGGDVFTVNGDGTGRFNVTQDSVAINRNAKASNNGGTIVFSSNRDGGHVELWSIPTAGGVATQITHNALTHTGDRAEDISSDGLFVTYSRTTDATSPTSQVGVIGIGGTGEHLFNAPGQAAASSARFSACL